MIPFNNYGHSKKTSGVDILYWVDASDSGSYSVDGANNVTQLINKGSAGGVFNVVGSPKYLNGGFEALASGDAFLRDINTNFLSESSFTFVTTYKESLSNTNTRYWSELSDGTNDERIGAVASGSNQEYNYAKTPTEYTNIQVPTLGVRTHIQSYNAITNTLIQLNFNGVIVTHNAVDFDSLNNSKIYLLRSVFNAGLINGANNPLHEFRLYDYAFNQSEMTDLQNELKTKWGKMLYHVDASDTNSFTTDGSNNVLSLNNLGTEGGSFTINGSPKYLNGGFESHSASDYFERDMGLNFLSSNSFTIAVTFDIDNLTGGSSNLNTLFEVNSDVTNNNMVGTIFITSTAVIDMWQKGSGVGVDFNRTLTIGKKTLVFSYDFATKVLSKLHYDGGFRSDSVTFNDLNNDFVRLLSTIVSGWGNSGANNPLHEFRLYNYAMSQQQMTDLQTQLNNKWI